MTEHLNITDLIMKRNDFDKCPAPIKMAIQLYAEATDLIENGFINEGHMREREAFEVLKKSGREGFSKPGGSQINEPYIPRDLLEMD